LFESLREFASLSIGLTAKLRKMPPEEQPAFEARDVAKINAIMKKAVLACSRVMAQPSVPMIVRHRPPLKLL
jgi:hypothetical protein